METKYKYNTKVPAVKRLMREAHELQESTEDYSAHPLEDNLFEWHFTVRGAPATEFENGVYHGRIILPNEYPMKPPNIILLTPNGRFEVNKKICLSISGYHPETWQPSWSIRTALLALIAFMPTNGTGTIGSLDYTPDERKALARRSQNWKCKQCGQIKSLLGSNVAEISTTESQLIKSVVFKAEDAVSTNAKEQAKTSESSPSPVSTHSSSAGNISPGQSPTVNEDLATSHPDTTSSSFHISERTSTVLITIIVTAISFLLYRRIFLL
ncbi:ubiquitin-conjugating enzyme E2 [Nesidiocoris tenuis]|uniref:Ubiquitin-conjugating enzyme E2 n=1 Tax=Nesidiocoris tenuis TaxID=355587 RepID=A0ABN7AHC3_9HEMI|nr:ubiquitin-conjugating enzyme E2 [Nesidiocoris tenuis]